MGESGSKEREDEEEYTNKVLDAGLMETKLFSNYTLSEQCEHFYGSFGVLTPSNLPIIYSDNYNISFWGLERLHPFDSCKYLNIVKSLKASEDIRRRQLVAPSRIPTREELLFVHSEQYLHSLNSSTTVAMITEIPPAAIMPNSLLWKRVLNPMLFATAGTILSVRLALHHGWCINLGGGFHHCSATRGGGFCPFADLTLAYRNLRKYVPEIKKVMIIDLDAHQGNGHERDQLKAADTDTYILDVYNGDIYPGDDYAKAAIRKAVVLSSGTRTSAYIEFLAQAMKEAFQEFTPDLILYNAGTDILDGDPLGQLRISREGVILRDEMVFNEAIIRKIPIAMALSGGYQKSNAEVIADSIRNLFNKFKLKDYLSGPVTQPESLLSEKSEQS